MSKYGTIKQRVDRGARWLDENFPGWEDRIDPVTLDLGSPFACICGQMFKKEAKRDKLAFGGFGFAFRNLFPQANSWISAAVGVDSIPRSVVLAERRKQAASPHGYYSSILSEASRRASQVSIALGLEIGDGVSNYRSLEREWRRILALRAKVA